MSGAAKGGVPMGSSNRHDRRAVGSVVCAVAVSAATVSSTGMAVADASDEYFIADVREDSLLWARRPAVDTLGNSVCSVLYGTMTVNPFTTFPGSALSPQDVRTVAQAAVHHYCLSVVDDRSPDA